MILYHLLRCDGTRHKTISSYCPFKALFLRVWGRYNETLQKIRLWLIENLFVFIDFQKKVDSVPVLWIRTDFVRIRIHNTALCTGFNKAVPNFICIEHGLPAGAQSPRWCW